MKHPVLFARALLATVFLTAALTSVAFAAEVPSPALATNGWFSDDTRADGTGSQVAGTNLISDTLTDDPEATASGTPAHDGDILAQIVFGAAPGMPPLATHPGAVHLQIAPGSGTGGKSQISHRKDDGTGHGPGSSFGPGFSMEYSWMGDGASAITASVKFGIKTSEFGTTGVSSRTGENVWDKVLIYEPGQGNGQTSDGLWHTETVDWSTGKWWFFDRTQSASIQSNPKTLQEMSTSTDPVGSRTIQDVYDLIVAAGAHVTSVQIGIGSNNPGGSVYVNQLETSFYRPGDVTTFGPLPRVHNLTQSTNHATIQDAVDAAVSGDQIAVDAGTFEEQVVIDGKDLEILGSGVGVTIVNPPVVMATVFNTEHPVITAMNTPSVVIRDMTIDGLGRGNGNSRMEGVAFWNAGGAVLDCDVTGIQETPFNGNQHGVCVYAYNNTGGPYALEVGGVNCSDFQKNAMALSGTGLTVNVHDCTATGRGDIPETAQNGIQVSYGASGTVTDCTVSDIRFTPATWVASGWLMYSAGTVTTSGTNLITDVQAPVSWYDTNGTIGGCEIPSGGDFDAVFVYNSTALLADGRALPQPFLETGAPATARFAPFSVSVSNGCLTGSGAAGTSGIYALASSASLALDVSNMSITGWDYGLVLDGAGVSCTANDDAIAGNLTAGLENSLSGNAVDAAYTWWGDASGPSGDGSGSGDAVVSAGGEVVFSPWLTDGTSLTTCGFTPALVNEVAPVDPGTCVDLDSTCVTVDVDITRSDNAGVRGFSVGLQLTNLALCGAGITEGTYLSSLPTPNTVFQVVDNGGGSYTVDGSILGLPCGQDAPTGTLFQVAVTGIVDGPGTIDVTSVILRDCVNVPVPASAGAPLVLTVDTVPPAAIADLAAAQVTTGNDSDGTTKIDLTFTAPATATSYAVFRKAYGDYPEYATGGIPTAPADPGAALTEGWTLAGVFASVPPDEPPVRDFWYYVVFSSDACGNVSAVSNVTAGTLNYHLGDVTNGFVNGTGDNLVNGNDITHLGAHYGETGALVGPVNWLDVGPTTNFFVDGRPVPDDVIGFEDLMMFAINFMQVSRPAPAAEIVRFEPPALALVVEPASTGPASELVARLVLDDVGSLVKGVHATVRWDAGKLELLDVGEGELLGRANGPVFLAPVHGEGEVAIDAAALGRGATLPGSGAVAELRFRVLAEGSVPALAAVDLRNRDNRPADRERPAADGDALAALDGAGSGEPVLASVPDRLELMGARPNPFADGTAIVFALPRPEAVRLHVYDVTGRLVRTLADRTLGAGEHSLAWDGRADDGQRVGTGVYFYRFEAGDVRETRKLLLFR